MYPLRDGIAMQRPGLEHAQDQERKGVEHYALALPYTIFVLYFRNNVFQSLFVGWRNKPLATINDYLGRPNLPNISDELAVCMGTEFKGIQWTGQRMAEQVSEVLGQFWQSEFNHDIADAFHGYRKAHDQFANLKTWARHSRQDPLFILNIPWRERFTLRGLVDKMGAANPDITKQLQNEVLAVVNTVSAKLTKALESVEIGQVRAGELTKQLAVVLQDILREAYQDCWKHCEKRLTEEEKRQRQTLEEVVREQLQQMMFLAPKRRSMFNDQWEQ